MLCYTPFPSFSQINFLMSKAKKGTGMGKKRIRTIRATFWVFFNLLLASFATCEASLTTSKKKSTPSQPLSSFVFPVAGNVYPVGYYSVSLGIGNPAKFYELDIDTGSDITWVQCDAPCISCTKPPDQLYKPKNNLVTCVDPLCSAIHLPGNFHCDSPKEQCDYLVDYADQGSSMGVLVSDHFLLQMTNGSQLGVRLSFGCGYDQKQQGHNPPPATSGVLGLGSGKASIISQLHSLGTMKNVVGHCLSAQGGGYLFFGDHLVPSGIKWVPLAIDSSNNHYTSGPAELFFGGRSTGVKGLHLIFDSGSSYSYFNAHVYQTVLNLIKGDLKGKPIKEAPEDVSLPVCWKGAKPFKSVRDVKSYFKPLTLTFTQARKAQLELPPEYYLIVTKRGNVCLGILNGGEVGLENSNVLGDISMQDKMVVYDHEKQQIGWLSMDCNKIPNSDGDYSEAFYQPFAANFGVAQEQQCPSSYSGRSSS